MKFTINEASRIIEAFLLLLSVSWQESILEELTIIKREKVRKALHRNINFSIVETNFFKKIFFEIFLF